MCCCAFGVFVSHLSQPYFNQETPWVMLLIILGYVTEQHHGYSFLTIGNGRDPTPRELHLHVYTHGHDEKSFVDEHARIVHERYEEILREKIESQSDIDQREAYYQAVGGEKKRRIYGLGSQAKSYYGPNLSMTSFSDASSSVPPPVEILVSHQSDTPVDDPSSATPIVPNQAVSEDDRISSPEN